MLLEIKTLLRRNSTGRGAPPRSCVLRCDVCASVYERPYSKAQVQAPVHRCSVGCAYGSRSTDGLGGRGAETIDVQCEVCGKALKRRRVDSERVWGHMCSRGCYGTYRSQHPESYAESVKSMQTSEAVALRTATRNERLASGAIVHPMAGRQHVPKTRELMRLRKAQNPLVGPNNGMFGRRHADEARSRMSEAKSKAILAGTFRPYGTRNRKGLYVSTKTGREHFFRSGWEETVMLRLDTDPNVATWDYECVRIPYVYNDNKRWYVPDFLVTFVGGQRELWEVKPKSFVGAEKNVVKEAAARSWCLASDVSQHRVLTSQDIVGDRHTYA